MKCFKTITLAFSFLLMLGFFATASAQSVSGSESTSPRLETKNASSTYQISVPGMTAQQALDYQKFEEQNSIVSVTVDQANGLVTIVTNEEKVPESKFKMLVDGFVKAEKARKEQSMD